MDVSENLMEKNPVGKLEYGGEHENLIDHGTDLYCNREEIGTNVYDKGDTCETYARKREDENPDEAINSHDYFCNEVDETLGEKDAPAEEPAHTWVILARKREAIVQIQEADAQKRRQRLMETLQGKKQVVYNCTEHSNNVIDLQTQAEEIDTGC